jgi:EAL domain-containing protein (putative c-di-GMP-specific phosphodiesterase class I)
LTQLELLGCNAVQGFYFSAAVKADVLLDVIAEIEKESLES